MARNRRERREAKFGKPEVPKNDLLLKSKGPALQDQTHQAGLPKFPFIVTTTGLLSALGFFLNQALSLGGVVNVTAMWIGLAVFCGAGISLSWLLIGRHARRKYKPIMATCVFALWIVGVVLLGEWARPLTISDLPTEFTHALVYRTNVRIDPPYEEKAVIAGIPWRKGSYIASVYLTSKQKVSNVDLKFEFDSNFIHAEQITRAPGLTLEPKSRGGGMNFEAGSLDKNGNVIKRYAATPEEDAQMSSYPANIFIYHHLAMFPDLPVTVAFVGGNGYQLGNFTYLSSGGTKAPQKLRVTGHYDIEYKGHSFTLPTNSDLDLAQPSPK